MNRHLKLCRRLGCIPMRRSHRPNRSRPDMTLECLNSRLLRKWSVRRSIRHPCTMSNCWCRGMAAGCQNSPMRRPNLICLPMNCSHTKNIDPKGMKAVSFGMKPRLLPQCIPMHRSRMQSTVHSGSSSACRCIHYRMTMRRFGKMHKPHPRRTAVFRCIRR